MNNIAYKFVKWDVDPLDELKNEEVYKLKEKANKGIRLTRVEKDRLYEMLDRNGYSKVGVPLQGWMFDFTDILTKFYVEYKYMGVSITYAPDKMSIRNNDFGIISISKAEN